MPSFEQFTTAFHEHFSRNPNECVDLGIDKHFDDLPDPSLAEVDARVASARKLLAQIDQTERVALSFDQLLDLDLARLKIEAAIHTDTLTYNGKSHYRQLPSACDDIGNGMMLLFSNDLRAPKERLANICARLEKVPAYLDALLARLDTPVARWVAMDLTKAKELPSFFATLEDWARTENWIDLERMSNARVEAVAALAAYTERLRALPTTTSFHIGDEQARRLVRLRGIEPSLEEIHQIATDFLHDTTAILEELRVKLAARYELDSATTVAALHRSLCKRFRVQVGAGGLATVLARYEAERQKVVTWIRDRDLFPIPDDQDMKLMMTPSFMVPSIPAGAMWSPPPFRSGVRTSLVYLTLAEELLDEHTELGIPGMIIHEGIPGHHLQLSTAATHPSVVRRHFSANDHAEGWTTMLEDYMLDMGYMGDLTDEGRFIGKRDISRIGARVAIDLFFMTGDRKYLDVGVDCDLSSPDPFVAAGNLLEAVTGFVPERVQNELNWYSQARGYPLSYLVGNRLVWRLRDDVNAHRAGSGAKPIEIDREFHRAYLESGNMPVSYLRRVYEHEGLIA